MSAIFFAFVSYFGWGIGTIFETITVRKLGPYSAVLWGAIFSIILLSFIAPFRVSELHQLTSSILIMNILLGALLLLGIIVFSEALLQSSASIVIALSQSFPALVVVFSVFFFKEQIDAKEIFAIGVIFLGLILLLFERKKGEGNSARKGILMSLFAMFAWGIYFTFIKIPVQQVGWFWPTYLSFAVLPLLFAYIKIKRIKIKHPNFQHAFTPLVLSMLFIRTAEMSFNFAVGNTLSALVAPIAGSSPSLTVLLTFFVFKEKLTKQQIVGIVITVLGIVILSFASV